MSNGFKLGDVFEVRLTDASFGYFQYVSDDSEQLGSAVIRVFSGVFSKGANEELPSILSLPIHFHAHVFLKSGVALNVWRKIGSSKAPRDLRLLFRASNDYGNPDIKISIDWDVWYLGEARQKVRILSKEQRDAERGEVINPKSIANRMRTGSYDGPYPDPA